MIPPLLLSTVLIANLAILVTNFPSHSNAHLLNSKQDLDEKKLGFVYWRNATRRVQGSVVPLPMKMQYLGDNLEDYIRVDLALFDIRLDAEVKSCQAVHMARERYLNHYLFDDTKPESKDLDPSNGGKELAVLSELNIVSSQQQFFECPTLPDENMNESYKLTISLKEANNDTVGPTSLSVATLSASSCWGVLRGLETFSQLIYNFGPKKFAIKPILIEDKPRFSHRGFMLDTSRHYITVETILDLLDAMSFNKMNVFHWHMVDDQSFPFESSTYPQLSKKGAYRPEMVYSHLDVQLIILYAAARGIRVMPELDTPGHTYALRHIPNLLSDCYDPKTGTKNGDFGPIDPTRATAYKSVNKLLNELFETFPDLYFHAGGDEVDFDCWRSNPEINRWMQARNMSNNYEELSNYYLRRLHNMVKNYNRTMLVWQEVFDMGAKLDNDAIIHVWKNINDKPKYMLELSKVVQQGYKAILSSCWYLNIIDYGQDWVKYYQCDPTATTIRAQDKHLVLGGEVCMWTEFVDDTNVISRTWPRASAAAERLWSSETTNNVGEFLHRLEQHRCRLINRGIRAEPINGPGYC